MRSFDDSMPEERNRVLTDHLAELLLCSTATAVDNLAAEGIDDGVRLVGDVMADVTLTMLPLAERSSDALERLGLDAAVVPARDGSPRRQRGRRRAARRGSSRCSRRCRCRRSFRSIPAPARGWSETGALARLEARRAAWC